MANNNNNTPVHRGEEESQSAGFPCDQCDKVYKNKKDLTRHQKAKHSAVTFPCTTCGKEFNVLTNKTRHEKTCNPGVKVFECNTCGKRCATEGGLRRHQESHQRGPPAEKSKKAPKRKMEEPVAGPSGATKKSRTSPKEFRCRRCYETFENRRELYVHGMRQHYQVGGGSQPVPWTAGQAPWEEEDGTLNENLRNVYEINSPLILEQHRMGPIESIYNFPVDNTINVNELVAFAKEIYYQQQYAIRLNLVFGMILQNRETGEYRYFTPYRNNTIFESPLFISKSTNLKKLKFRLRSLDILNELLVNRPDTKWLPVLITNVQFYVTSTHYPVGQGILPDYLTKKESVYPLVKNRHNGKPYNDNLCAFRCLALHRKHDIKNLEGPTQQLYREWSNFIKSDKEFHGISFEEFPDFESCFKINMEVYSLEEDGTCRSIYKSRGRYDTTMYVNLYQNHLSYIKNFPSFAKKFQCKTCDRHFPKSNDLHRHQRICTNKTKYVYPGGFYQPYESIFDKLEQFGIKVPEDQRTFKWFICYDFEAMLQKVEEQPSKNLQWTQKHIPISVSICSNVEEHKEAFCIVEPEQDKLVESMVVALREIAGKVRELSETKWGWVLKEIQRKIEKKDIGMNLGITQVVDMEEDEESEDEEEDDDEENDTIEKTSENDDLKPLKRLYGQMEGYMTQVPVLGFNSAKYDLNLIKRNLACHLNMHDQEQKATFVVKKNNAYTCISSDQLKFLDISQFLAAGSSYAHFLKAYQVDESKGYFPYEWLDDVAKLEEKELPPHEAFYSSLKHSNITEEEYQHCHRVWKEKSMKKFRDFLVWYNNLDVGPFVTAVECLQHFYFEKGIDVFKTAISVPGIARQMLFRSAKDNNASFALFDKNNADLYETVKNNIVGGPSIIFHRHHKAGVTRIRGGKKCGAILGFDANALYLQCIGKPMPVGPFVRRLASNGFKPDIRDRFMSATYWMDWLIQTEGKIILHKQNHGSEIRVGKYPVDGFSPADNKGSKPTCYQFHGCYWHGHGCFMTKHVQDQKWWENREKKLKKTAEITKYLEDKGCNVVEMWECQFRNFCQKTPEINAFIDEHRPGFFRHNKGKKIKEDDILRGVLDESLFGMVEVDIEVPDQWPTYFRHPTMTPYEYFEEMSPLFCNTEVPFEAMGKHMQHHVQKYDLSKIPRRLLVGGMKARQILLATPLLKWYLNHGMVVSKVYQVVEFQQQRCFEQFVKEVSDARRMGDVDPDKAIIGETWKTNGNSSYGSMIMDKTKHRKIDYIQGENETCLKVNDPRFRKLECLDQEEQYYEVEMAKKKIKLDLPIQLGYFVLQYAKLRMLEFYYDFIDVYVDRSDFAYCEMDTDSAYMAISERCLDDVIKPEMKEKYEKGLKGFCRDGNIEANDDFHWFPRSCCEQHAKYDKRTPGLFKLEYQGEEMIGLCSKTYIVRKSKTFKPSSTRIVAYNLLRKARGLKRKKLHLRERISNEYKFSSKGVTKRNIKTPMSIFRHVLQTGNSKSGTNRGFRARDNTIFTYTQERRGFSYFYCKRVVEADGVSTSPLDITLCPIPKKEEEVDDQEVIDALAELLDEQ